MNDMYIDARSTPKHGELNHIYIYIYLYTYILPTNVFRKYVYNYHSSFTALLKMDAEHE